MFIYKITNKINNKVYIGQSIRPIEHRFRRHINDALNNVIDTHFARAIRKYGKENFYIELIDLAETQDELNQKEQYWIRYYDSVNSLNGYNETSAIYKCGGNTYQSKTEKEMAKIKDKIKKTKFGLNNPNAKPVKCFNINTREEYIFDTVKQCKDFFGEETHRFITSRVRHQTKSLYKGEWNISYLNKEYDIRSIKTNKTGTKIKVTNLNTLNEHIFESIRLASKSIGISRNKINKLAKDNNVFTIDIFEFTILN
ncbi:MAG: GIY-YIG nuclease family protein [Bacteroidales bacterium]|nr:GIY-YIG nuclease family protein [Bacteroidales bacterium]